VLYGLFLHGLLLNAKNEGHDVILR
jgi:hypothetical protein